MTTKPNKNQPDALAEQGVARQAAYLLEQMRVAAPELRHRRFRRGATSCVGYNQHVVQVSFVLFRVAADFSHLECMLCLVPAVQPAVCSLTITGSNQANRAISTGQLNMLPCLHLRPIDEVVYLGPQGYLVLRGASRLDAFSGYPVRT